MSDASKLAAHLGFAGNPLDRLSELRDNAAALADLAGAAARAVVFAQAMPILQSDGEKFRALMPLAEARQLGDGQIEVLLGRDDKGAVYALHLPDAAAGTAAPEAGVFDERRLTLPGRPDLSLVDCAPWRCGASSRRRNWPFSARRNPFCIGMARTRFVRAAARRRA